MGKVGGDQEQMGSEGDQEQMGAKADQEQMEAKVDQERQQLGVVVAVHYCPRHRHSLP